MVSFDIKKDCEKYGRFNSDCGGFRKIPIVSVILVDGDERSGYGWCGSDGI